MGEQAKDNLDLCRCPYCDARMEELADFCTACKMVIVECARCGKPVREGVELCPHCSKPPA